MKNVILSLVVLFSTASISVAQKIAYADINAILSVMPENKKMNEDLKIYSTGLQKPLEDMKKQLDGMSKEFQRVLALGDTAKALEIQKQAIAGDKQFQEAVQKAEQQLAQKRNESLQPILGRIRGAMESVAKKNGFEYVMNSVDGSGTSIVLWGPEGADITRKVVDELGIKLEGAVEETAPSPSPTATDKKKKK